MMRSITFGLIAWIGVVVVSCGVPQEQYDADITALKDALEQTKVELGKTTMQLAEMRNEKEGLERQLAGLNAELARLANENSEQAKLADQARKRLETFRKMLERFSAMVKSGKLKIKIVNNKMLVEMASAILFDSGSAKLSEEGEEALTQVAGILATIPNRNFQVAGHTDNVPIRKKRFKSNWSLSAGRAVAVVQHLIENGVAMESVSAAGYGETQPVASNENEEGKAQNRRIEIVLQPNLDELPDLSSLESMIN
ncbi:MAG: OmpA family protein [Deltaproteobacteria bacterium]|nr:OmpA family protein [Deltaproteobacteria bacterium]